jgi:phage shock protein PspC (stress-responsive transcriptional regulator)
VSGTQRQPHPLAGAEDTLKDFWTSRPRRPRRGRKLAGVAVAIGNRYAIDPVIVRIAFVVSAFYGGAGIMLYLFGWLFFPEQNDEEAPFMAMVHQGRSSTSTFFTALLCLTAIGVSFWTFGGGGAGFVGLILLIIAMYLLHRHRGDLGQQTGSHAAAPTQPQPTMPIEVEMNTPITDPEPPRTQPPAWDPLGAAPFAWDLPEPTPLKPEAELPAPRKRAKVGGVTLGAALAIGGACVLIAPYNPWLSAGHIVGIVLAVIGVGMVGGSLLGGGRGLIGLAVPLALAGFVFANDGHGFGPPGFGPPGGSGPDFGSINDTPTTIESVMPGYSLSGGSIHLDLSALPNTGTIHTSVSVGVGNVSVVVPADADVQIDCDANLGSVKCLGQDPNGTPVQAHVVDKGPDGTGGLQIYLDAHSGTGTVEVRRG